MSKPTFVIVHGAWHRPAHFEPLMTALNRHGYRAVAPALPSVHKAPTEIVPDHHEDVAAVRQAILDELDGGADVIVVPHSYGGIPASGAVRGLDRQSRAAAGGHTTAVVAIAAITSFIIPAGTSIVDTDQHERPTVPDILAPPPAELFYHDLLPAAESERWSALLNPMSSHALFDTCTFSAYTALPIHYLMATDDRAMDFAKQERVVARMRAADGAVLPIRTEVLQGCGHSPFLSRVEETVAFLRRSAGEDVPEGTPEV
ncbi:uncharacterized protein Z519_04777 [Cladophialophora bantiana CBS 173.52]|uniref:AB hydrolase-1 domain-containing protein n=1 Tax=Cladophialophora bantiana (strain ATCC 10958 / CBS 173.52 / CDC B-1940 / NIH 8579) TaxID=1442370 RepID=A0A0D2HVA0_CLAB1|nr:uncharacterized protein Z519_04777 [Cladophialophora bantiana CBS 173.52]KIW94800.1 hypothetical protein Z519_04777 [Cladophialophora bantiana CBS 173.52]